MAALLALLLAQAAAPDGLEPVLAQAREKLSPVLVLWVDDGASSASLLKLIDQDAEVRTAARSFLTAQVRAPKPDTLLDLPLPLVAVVEPTLVPRGPAPDPETLLRSARARLGLAGEWTSADEVLVSRLRRFGRGGSLRIGRMGVYDCSSILKGWIRERFTEQGFEFKDDPIVLKAVTLDTTIEFEGGPEHTFESILRAMAGQNRLVLYPQAGTVVLSPELPAKEIGPDRLKTFLAAHAEPEVLSEEDRDRFSKAMKDLSEDDPKVRGAASKVLQDAGPRVRRLLRRALAEAQDPETRSRLEEILRAGK
jgi:hypothetical protein